MKKKIILLISIVLLLLFLVIFILIYNYNITNIKTNKRIKVTLSKCVDGDTVWLTNNKIEKKYRLLGIDSPELKDNYGNESKDYTCNFLKNAKTIEIQYDDVGYKKDKYNRELVWVFVDNELLQTKILEKGYAKVKYIYANYEYLNNLYDKENYAIENKIGIWENYGVETYNVYYTVTFDYTYKNKTVNILKNNMIGLIDNPYKEDCRFIGWKNGNYLFDLTTKINKDYKLKAEFDC